MTTTATIMALTDFSPAAEQACRRAAQLARDLDARLHLVHVMPERPVSALDPLLPGSIEVIRGMVRDTARHSLQQLADHLCMELKVPAAPVLREGRLLPTLLEEADRLGASLLVMGAEGQSALRPFLLGSTAERLLHKSSRPSLVVKAAAREPYQRVLVPVDFSADSAAALRLAEQLLPEAGITVLHVYDPEFTDVMVDWPTEDALACYHEEEERQAAAALATFMQATTGTHRHLSTVLKSGQARQCILETASALQTDLIVMGSQGHDFMEQTLLGSHTRHVLAESSCDVLINPHPL